MTKLLKKYALPMLIIVAAIVALLSPRYIEPQFYLTPSSSLAEDVTPIFNTYQVVSGMTQSVHSATSVELENGNLLSMWYGGTREGHTDVTLYSSVFDKSKGTWGNYRSVLDRYDVADSLNRYIKKIGNPILIKHPQGPIVLIYVSVSLAGWATSNLNMAVSYDEGQSWHDSKRLVTSPFLNISTLVKNDAVIYTDGTIGITAYHELKGEYSEMVRVNLNGDVINQYRVTSGTNTIQPSLVVRNKSDAIALMRDTSRDAQRVHLTETKDGGRTWSPYEVLNVKNPNSAVYGFSDIKGRTWMVFNDSTRDTEHSRNNLALAVSDKSARNWKTVYYFENPELDIDLEAKYAYPWLTKSSNNEYQLFYTVNRKSIKHIQFNQAWLEGLL